MARHGSTKQAILRGLADHGLPALSGLGARDDADLTIALADGFAVMADVLTFYTGRIAQEHYLRTATERLSVVELSRLIGYRPAPGVAADAWLAFTVEAPVTVPYVPPRPVRVPVGTAVQSVPGQDEAPVTFETVTEIEARAENNAVAPVNSSWPASLAARTSLHLAGTGHRLQRGDVLLFLGAQRQTTSSSTEWAARTLESAVEEATGERTRVTWEPALPALPVAGMEVHVLRLRAAVFGHNAPDPRLLAIPTATLHDLVDTTVTPWQWTTFGLSKGQLDLDQVHPQVVADGWALVRQGSAQHLARIKEVTNPSLSAFGVSSKATRISLDSDLDPSTFDRRSLLVLAQSEELPLAADPLTTGLADEEIELLGALELAPGQALAVLGPLHGARPGAPEESEVVLVDDAPDAVVVNLPVDGPPTTTVRLGRPLQRSYDRVLARINANVAAATEGAGVGQILGSGDARVPGQWFVLNHRPLTWLATDAGLDAALEVRVEDVVWHRRETLFGAGPGERVHVLETSDEGTTVVRFGDGVEGARLPTGQANVRVQHRTGLGAAGNVRTAQLTTLLSRPLGVASVLNPSPGTGGEDPEPLESARRNAPVTVRTLDRVVSLLDAEDFARAQPGVAKASAGWVPHGPARGLVLTLTGPDGATIDESVPTHGRVLAALREHGDARLVVHLLGHRPVGLEAWLRVLPHPDHLVGLVLADVRRELLAAFSVDARELGQPTSLGQVVEVVHRAPGVVAVDVDVLRRTDAPASVQVQHRVPAHPGGLDPAGTGVLGAELLVLADPDLHVEVMA
ncbi:hypothetical protein [Blastococcus saxobsidens]|uniref:Baseplate assembly protein n=1 Tax=Blastococcus saxobsidens (strain DD2) TaxID=1146883 RepID=H6RPG7_BLASD|nr:hypothetical protein [Blastococcus saxobsidens]CCG04026.1 conserved protein of unknown function [Blastococcus saxobsidens DD2]